MVLVILQPVNDFDREAVEYVRESIIEVFPVEVSVLIAPWHLTLPLEAFDFARRQYVAEAVNAFLAARYESVLLPGRVLVLGIVEGDGYSDGLNFVFGLASPGVGVASVYTRRLRLGASRELFLERLAKVSIHELGHLFGLGHCRNYCVMRFSNSLSELDEKPRFFCEECRVRLRRALGG